MGFYPIINTVTLTSRVQLRNDFQEFCNYRPDPKTTREVHYNLATLARLFNRVQEGSGTSLAQLAEEYNSADQAQDASRFADVCARISNLLFEADDALLKGVLTLITEDPKVYLRKEDWPQEAEFVAGVTAVISDEERRDRMVQGLRTGIQRADVSELATYYSVGVDHLRSAESAADADNCEQTEGFYRMALVIFQELRARSFKHSQLSENEKIAMVGLAQSLQKSENFQQEAVVWGQLAQRCLAEKELGGAVKILVYQHRAFCHVSPTAANNAFKIGVKGVLKVLFGQLDEGEDEPLFLFGSLSTLIAMESLEDDAVEGYSNFVIKWLHEVIMSAYSG